MLTVNDIVCYVPVYNDREALERNLIKLQRMGINALIVDGRFTDFPQIRGSDYSTDGTEAFKQAVNCHYFEFPPDREENKMNFALQKAHELGYKVFMFCGADAYYEADMDEFMLNLQRFYEQYAVEPTQLMVSTEEKQPDAKWNNTAARQPRIYLNYWKIEARHLHWCMYEKGAPDDTPLIPSIDVVEGIKLTHDNSVRPAERDNLMTEYQDFNVPRERESFMNHVVPKAYEKVALFTWKLGVDGTFEEGRRAFFKSDECFSHFICVDEGYDLDSNKHEQFTAVLHERNNMMNQLPIITAVWESKEATDHFTLNPGGDLQMKWPKYPKIEQLYSKKGLELGKNYLLVAPYTRGPVVCISRHAMQLIEHIGNKLDFLAIINGLGMRTYADARIQYEWKT